MKLTSLIWPILTALGTALGWHLGRQAQPMAYDSTQSAGSTTVTQQAGPAHGGGASGKKRLETNGAVAAGQMVQALSNPNPSKALQSFLAALDGMTEENVESFRDTFRRLLGEGRAPYEFQSHYNRRLGEVMGVKQLAKRTGDANDMKAFGAVCDEMRGAMMTDPKGVRDWYDGLKNEQFREGLLQPYLTALAASDTNAVLAMIPSLPAEFQPKCISSVTSALVRQGGDAAIRDWFDQLASKPAPEQPPWLKTAFADVLHKVPINRYAAPDWATFLEKHLGQTYADSSTAAAIASSYMYSHPESALAWVQRISAKDSKLNAGQLYGRMANDARAEDLSGIADWCLQKLSGGERAQALAGLQSRVASLAPDQQNALTSKLSAAAP